MRTLSKSKLLAYLQCPKRLWLEINHPELRQDSAATQASFDTGNVVGEIARRLYDPGGKGQLIDAQKEGYPSAFARSTALLGSASPIFEAAFSAGGALFHADVMLPTRKAGKRVWRMIEVKSSASVKDYHRNDAAIQTFISRAAGVPLHSIALAHIDSSWTYPGNGEYQGLLKENDLTAEAFDRGSEVKGWIAGAKIVLGKKKEPSRGTGRHCHDPYECGFLTYCQSQEPQPKYPVSWLPRIQAKELKALIEQDDVRDLREVPDSLLNEIQQRVKQSTLKNKIYFDSTGAAADLAAYKLPIYFLDFETIYFAVPIWKGTRPYQMTPFQFSMHRLSRTRKLDHQSFLDLSGGDPSKRFAQALIGACGTSGAIFAYNASFEKSRLEDLAARFPAIKRPLLAIHARIVDLLPIAQKRYYHPRQKGSWSIKEVLPAVAPDFSYDKLKGVQDGGMAMSAYLEAISPATSKPRKDEIEKQLLDYCALDTKAMAHLWRHFAGYKDLKI